MICGSYNPACAVTQTVWALPLSLAATYGITVVFFSSAGGTIGEFISEDGATAAISGGIFGNDVSAWVAADYICVANDDGTYSIKYLPTIAIADAELYEDGTEVIISGTVSAITTPWNDTYGNITVIITDGTNSITVYRLATNVAVGDIKRNCLRLPSK